MKKLTNRVMFAVAALAVAAVSASAQTYTVKVPMSFKVGDKLMAPGTYRVDVISTTAGNHALAVRNTATARGAMAVSFPGKEPSKAWKEAGNAVIAFECLGSHCSLSRLWDGSNSITYQLPAQKAHPADAERMASIVLPLTRAD